MSFGYDTAWLSKAYRAANPVDAPPLATAESGVELTYTDRLAKWLAVQPDVQYVWHPFGVRFAHNALVLGLRINIGFDLH